MRVVSYVRVSSTEQVKGYSIEAQITAIREWCTERNYEIVQVYEEKGKSAKSDERPEFQRMTSDLTKRVVRAEAVVFHKIDRFARSLRDLLNYKSILNTHNISVYSTTEDYVNDDSPESKLMLYIFGALAEYDNLKRADESKKGIDAMLQLGIYPGSSLPYGYVRVGEKRQASIIIAPEKGPSVQTAFREYATGEYTLRSWAKEAKEKGWPGQVSLWQRTFRNVFYVGKFVWAGIVYEGTHPPLVKEDTFKKVNGLLTTQNSGGSKKRHIWLLSGLLWSDMHQRPMTGTLAKGKYPYYRARTRMPGEPDHTIRGDELESRVIDLLSTLRATGEPLPITQEWEWGIQAVDNLKKMWDALPTKKSKRHFLNLIFFPKGIEVLESGRVRVKSLKAGFERIENNV